MHAEALHHSARYIWSGVSKDWPQDDDPGLLAADVAFSLGGAAVEATIKAAMLAKYDWPIDDARYRSITQGRHDLAMLARDAGLRTNSSDRLVLSDLSHYVRWRARYPIPKSVEEYHQFHSRKQTRVGQWDGYCAVRIKLTNAAYTRMRTWSLRISRSAKPRAERRSS
jgi:hypothetical protein